jgi:hypothetical protein
MWEMMNLSTIWDRASVFQILQMWSLLYSKNTKYNIFKKVSINGAIGNKKNEN